MPRLRKMRLWLPVILIGSLIFLGLAGCAKRVIYQTPQLKEKAVLKLPLDPEPRTTLTDADAKALYAWNPVITGKIMGDWISWEGWADIAKTIIKAHEDYELDLHSPSGYKKSQEPQKEPEKPSRHWWQFWK